MSTLEKMPGHTRLYRRNATYYHRAVVPKDIIETYGKVEETFSLKTKDRDEALRLVRIKAVEVNQRFEDHRELLKLEASPPLPSLSYDQLRAIRERYYVYLLDEDDAKRLSGFDEFVDTENERIWEGDRSDLPRDTFEEHQANQDSFSGTTKAEYARGKVDEFIRDEAEEVLSWDGINLRLAAGSESWPKLYRALQEAIIQAANAVKGRDQGDIIETPEKPPAASERTNTASSFPILSVASQQFISERARTNWTEKTKKDFEAQLRNFLETFGNRPIDDYSKKDGRKFKSLLEALPANWRKKPELRNLKIAKAADKAAKLKMAAMSLENANKAMNRVANFWKWADHNYFDEPGPAPLEGMNFKINRSQREKRDPFTPVQLTQIFHAPVFTGHPTPRNWADTGRVIDTASSRFWLPLLGLFTGAREAEIFFLTPNDVRFEDGIAMICIEFDEASGKRVKTSASIRKIPVHNQLIRLGFLQLVADRKLANAKSLFHDCETKDPARAADNFSKWFSRFLTSLGAKTPKHVFHSFRHNIEDAYRNGQAEPHMMDALQGHAEKGMRAIYGNALYRPALLKDVIEKVQYPGLSLGHLNGYPMSDSKQIVKKIDNNT